MKNRVILTSLLFLHLNFEFKLFACGTIEGLTATYWGKQATTFENPKQESLLFLHCEPILKEQYKRTTEQHTLLLEVILDALSSGNECHKVIASKLFLIYHGLHKDNNIDKNLYQKCSSKVSNLFHTKISKDKAFSISKSVSFWNYDRDFPEYCIKTKKELEVLLSGSSSKISLSSMIEHKPDAYKKIFANSREQLWWRALPTNWKYIFLFNYKYRGLQEVDEDYYNIWFEKRKFDDEEDKQREVERFWQMHYVMDDTHFEFFLKDTIASDSQIVEIKKMKRIDNIHFHRCWECRVFMHGGFYVSNLEPLRELKDLEDLDLRRSKITSLAPLRNLVKLEYLDISGSDVSNLEPLRGLKKLKRLYIDYTKVSDLSPLDNLSLEWIDCIGNKVTKLEIKRFKTKNPKCEIRTN